MNHINKVGHKLRNRFFFFLGEEGTPSIIQTITKKKEKRLLFYFIWRRRRKKLDKIKLLKKYKVFQPGVPVLLSFSSIRRGAYKVS